MNQSLGLYLHIPFCLQKCRYCDFCSFPWQNADAMEAYTDELCRRLGAWSEACRAHRVDTVYFGGGTPTLLPLSCFERLMGCLADRYDLAPDCEITCECNPATADLPYLSALRGLGINRLSIGLQSVHDRELRLLGRAHSYGDFRSLFAAARRAGFDNISADLMYGIPEQTADSFRQSLTSLAELAPEHISAYGLKIEEGTPFAAMADRLPLPDEDEEFYMYCLCGQVLEKYGYRKYEISNFAKPGKESRHNLRYWKRQDYLGFGVAAHSCFEGARFGNSRDITAFLAGEDITAERTRLTEQDKKSEVLMLGLRLTEGLELSLLARLWQKTEAQAEDIVLPWLRQGFLKRENGRLSFTDKGFFVSNTILSDLIDLIP